MSAVPVIPDDRNPSSNKTSERRRELLNLAAQNGDTELLQLLVETHFTTINPDCTDSELLHGTALHCAAGNGHADCLRILLSDGSIGVNTTESHGRTALHMAIQNNHTECVQLLLSDSTTNVNATDSSGWTPLHTAVQNGNLECVKLLLSHPSILVNISDTQGNPPLALVQELNNLSDATKQEMISLFNQHRI